MSQLQNITLEELNGKPKGKNFGEEVNTKFLPNHPIQNNNLTTSKIIKPALTERIFKFAGILFILTVGVSATIVIIDDRTPFKLSKLVAYLGIIFLFLVAIYNFYTYYKGKESTREIKLTRKSITLSKSNIFYWNEIENLLIKRFYSAYFKGTRDFLLIELKSKKVIKYEITYLDQNFLKHGHHGELIHLIKLYSNIDGKEIIES